MPAPEYKKNKNSQPPHPHHRQRDEEGSVWITNASGVAAGGGGAVARASTPASHIINQIRAYTVGGPFCKGLIHLKAHKLCLQIREIKCVCVCVCVCACACVCVCLLILPTPLCYFVSKCIDFVTGLDATQESNVLQLINYLPQAQDTAPQYTDKKKNTCLVLISSWIYKKNRKQH